MKLSEIQIDRYGVWRDLTLAMRDGRLNVLYGPNEAGKSTLLQFVRGVLYGFSPRVTDSDGDCIACGPMAGSLLVENGAVPRRIHRAAVGASRGNACLVGEEAARAADEALSEVLQGIDSRVFDGIFAVGLRDVQELGTLSGDEVAEHVYGLTLGLQGRRLLDALRRGAVERCQLIDPLQQSGTLVQLFERRDELLAHQRSLESRQQRHAEWCRRRDELEHEIADLRERQAGIREQLRGHVFLERAWGPWKRIRECRKELGELPNIAGFPERGLERLDKLDEDIAAAADCRDRLLAEGRQLCRRRQDARLDRNAVVRAAAMRGLVAHEAWLRGILERIDCARARSDEAGLEFEIRCEALGPNWTAQRIEAADVSATAHRKLAGVAQSFLGALARRRQLSRLRRRLASDCRDLRESLAESLHDLGGESIESAVAVARSELSRLHDIAALKLRETELCERQVSLEESRARIIPQLTLPRWVYIVLSVFCFMGIVLAGWGLVAGVTTSGIAGAIYALLGITCGGLAWGLRTQYEGDARARLAEIDERSQQIITDLVQLRRTIGCQAPPADATSSGAPAAGQSRPADHSEQVASVTRRLADLEEVSRGEKRLASMRRRLASVRSRLEIAQREAGTARESWYELLAGLGLPQDVEVDTALDAWQKVVDAAGQLSRWKQARAELEAAQTLWSTAHRPIIELQEQLGEPAVEPADPRLILEGWRQKLAEIDRRRQEQRDLRAQVLVKRREAREYRSLAEELKVQRNALLVQGGAATRDEFEERARHAARRTYLEDQCHDARRDLDAVAEAHSDVALVEDDLIAFDPMRNTQCIETLELEAADLVRDVEQAFERIGSVKREIEALEDDREPAQVRFELEQVHEELKHAAHEWAALETAARIIEDMRRDYERTHQPAALEAASAYLARLTTGKYARVWTPLGERRLKIDDSAGRSFPVESLSRGTREQLFLAVRLAVVDELARKGVSLPMVLDDVIVNFDERRAEAAVDLLIDFAAQGRQVLYFTCHLHLAHLFENKGVEPIWLPSHNPPIEEPEAQRRAAG